MSDSSRPIRLRRVDTKVLKQGRYRASKIRALLQARGLPARVAAARVREHVGFLHSIGFSQYAIGAAAGVSQGLVSDVLLGHPNTHLLEHAARLLSVTHRPVPSQSGLWVAPGGMVRRLEALQAAGYPKKLLGPELGVTGRMVGYYLETTHTKYETWVAVEALYERLSVHPGPSTVIAKRAAANGALLPMEWEGYDIDDPRVTPPRSIRSGRQPCDEEAGQHRRAEVERLTALGFSAPEIADRLGVSPRQITRYRADLKQKGTAA